MEGGLRLINDLNGRPFQFRKGGGEANGRPTAPCPPFPNPPGMDCRGFAAVKQLIPNRARTGSQRAPNGPPIFEACACACCACAFAFACARAPLHGSRTHTSIVSIV
jgi:hypothetical protein